MEQVSNKCHLLTVFMIKRHNYFFKKKKEKKKKIILIEHATVHYLTVQQSIEIICVIFWCNFAAPPCVCNTLSPFLACISVRCPCNPSARAADPTLRGFKHLAPPRLSSSLSLKGAPGLVSQGSLGPCRPGADRWFSNNYKPPPREGSVLNSEQSPLRSPLWSIN